VLSTPPWASNGRAVMPAKLTQENEQQSASQHNGEQQGWKAQHQAEGRYHDAATGEQADEHEQREKKSKY